MKILFDGDSFCYGAELTNINDRYSDIIGKELDCDTINLSEIGSSNQAIIFRAHKYIEENPIDLVVIGITFFSRFSLPFNDKLISMNGARFAGETPKNLIARYIYSSNTNLSIWYEYNYPILKMFQDSCKIRNIPLVYHTNDKEIRKAFNNSTIDVLPMSFNELAKTYKCSFGKAQHPLEEAHEKYAEYLLGIIAGVVKR